MAKRPKGRSKRCKRCRAQFPPKPDRARPPARICAYRVLTSLQPRIHESRRILTYPYAISITELCKDLQAGLKRVLLEKYRVGIRPVGQSLAHDLRPTPHRPLAPRVAPARAVGASSSAAWEGTSPPAAPGLGGSLLGGLGWPRAWWVGSWGGWMGGALSGARRGRAGVGVSVGAIGTMAT